MLIKRSQVQPLSNKTPRGGSTIAAHYYISTPSSTNYVYENLPKRILQISEQVKAILYNVYFLIKKKKNRNCYPFLYKKNQEKRHFL